MGPYNVTEDADLGIRMARFGYKTDVITNTFTAEESPNSLYAWFKQRTRWNKGHIKTVLVNCKTFASVKQLGFVNFIQMFVGIGLGIFAMLMSVVSFCSGIAILMHSKMGYSIFWEDVYLRVFSVLNIVFFILSPLPYLWISKNRSLRHFIKPALLIPIYFILQTVATFNAIYELIFKTHHWNKTPRNND
jgi:cellulose synthase/poly-beta-1,6-N-acetylglucosamine synthase-like glycosyltransferase